MNILRYLMLAFVCVLLVIFDVVFLVNFQLYGATIFSSFLFLVIFAISGRRDDYIFIAFCLVLLFAVFSSLPIWLSLILFIILPSLLHFIRQQYFPEPNVLSSLLYFFAATLCFDFILLVYADGWSIEGAISLASFVAANTLAGCLMFAVAYRFREKRGVIKV